MPEEQVGPIKRGFGLLGLRTPKVNGNGIKACPPFLRVAMDAPVANNRRVIIFFEHSFSVLII